MKKLTVLVRDAGWKAAFDVGIAAFAGALIAFMLMYALMTVFDRAWYEVGLHYDEYREADAPAAVSVLRTTTVTLAPATDAPTIGSRYGDLLNSHDPVVRIVASEALDPMRDVLGSSLVEGSLSNDGVVIDGAQAAMWSVGIGDTVVLNTDDAAGNLHECVPRISGVTRPYRGQGADDMQDGQILVPQGACDEVVAALLAEDPGVWEVYGEGGASKRSRVWAILASPEGLSVLVIGIMAVGTALWVLVSTRGAARVDRAAAESAMTLVRNGATPRSVRRIARLLAFASVTLGTVGALLIADFALREVAGFYAQLALICTVGLLMAIVGGIAQAVRLRGWPVRRAGAEE